MHDQAEDVGLDMMDMDGADPRLVLGLNGGRIIRGRIIPSNTVSYIEQVKMPV
jgi:hypothetical protein